MKALFAVAVFGAALGLSGCSVLDLLTENTQDEDGRHGVIDTVNSGAATAVFALAPIARANPPMMK